jgi:hypothetical protein
VTTRTASTGALGPELVEAIAAHTEALARLEHTRAAFTEAQRTVSETNARLAALAAGARVTGSRALVAVEDEADPPEPTGDEADPPEPTTPGDEPTAGDEDLR